MEPAAPADSFFDFSLFGWPWTGLVTLFALFVYYGLAFRVGKARQRHGVHAPSTDGPIEFMTAFRIQQNTLEQLVVFLPLLWMAALSSRDELAALIGVFWPVSRIIYAMGYLAAPKKRATGFVFGVVVLAALFALVAVQLVQSLLFFAGEQPPALAHPH